MRPSLPLPFNPCRPSVGEGLHPPSAEPASTTSSAIPPKDAADRGGEFRMDVPAKRRGFHELNVFAEPNTLIEIDNLTWSCVWAEPASSSSQ